MEDRRVLSIAHTEKEKAVLGMEDREGDVGATPLGLTHKCLPTKRKGQGAWR